MSDYRYDVFVSHKRGDVFNEWTKEHFIPLFRAYLGQDVRRFCKRAMLEIFYDERTIEPGSDWRVKLRTAIQQSRCMISLCSPEYFYSEWCQVEWDSFRKRGKLRAVEVLIPISVHDGEDFPTEAQELQAANLSSFVIVGSGFKMTSTYVEFQQRLKELSESVAKRVRDAPAYELWPIVEPPPLDGVSQTKAPPQQPSPALATFE